MNVSPSEVDEYYRCRRRWRLGSRSGNALTTIIPATALALGTHVHAALGKWATDPTSDPRKTFMESAVALRIKAEQTYYKQTGLHLEQARLQVLDDAVTLGCYMCENYVTHWKSPLPENFTLVEQEQLVVIPIPNTMHTEEWSWDSEKQEPVLITFEEPQPHYLKIKMDGVIVNRRRELFVLEHKTYNARPRPETLRMNRQFTAYAWGLTQLPFDMPVMGVAYDGLWKRAAIPKKVDNREGVMSDLFIRMPIPFPPEMLQEYEQFLTWTVNEMANNPAIYTNRTSDGSCGWGCSFNKMCMAMSRGEDTDWFLKHEFTQKANDELDSDDDDDTSR